MRETKTVTETALVRNKTLKKGVHTCRKNTVCVFLCGSFTIENPIAIYLHEFPHLFFNSTYKPPLYDQTVKMKRTFSINKNSISMSQQQLVCILNNREIYCM